jgi:hypothetical protein
MRPLTRLFRLLRYANLIAAVVQFVVIFEGARVAVAVDGTWSNPAGGSFHDNVNWALLPPLPTGRWSGIDCRLRVSPIWMGS